MTIWRYWQGPTPPPHAGWSERLIRSLYPERHLRDLGPGDVAHIHIPNTVVHGSTGRQWYRHVSNVVRWNLLLVNGGTYFDHDVIPIRSLPEGPWVAGHGMPCTGALNLPAGHPLAQAMVEAINEHRRGRPRLERSEAASGEVLLASILGDFPDVHIVPFMFDHSGRQVAPWSPLIATWHDQ
jgi:hypothetical protein